MKNKLTVSFDEVSEETETNVRVSFFYIDSYITGGCTYNRKNKKERIKMMQETTLLEKRRTINFFYNFLLLKKLIYINNLITQQVNLY